MKKIGNFLSLENLRFSNSWKSKISKSSKSKDLETFNSGRVEDFKNRKF